MKYYLASFAVVVLDISSSAFGLTIYRIGGADQPPPTLEAPYEFMQLDWDEFEASSHGNAYLVELDDGFLRPQLLDPNVNLSPLINNRGGRISNVMWSGWMALNDNEGLMFDQDPNTSFLGDGQFANHWPFIKGLFFDLGAPLPLERVRFYPREHHLDDRFVETFKIGINDGDPLKDGTREFGLFNFDFDIVHDVIENTEAVIDLKLPPVPIRIILFHAAENARGIWEIAEFEIYGKGFVPVARYVSNVIDLGAPASLGQLTWAGQQDEGAKIELSTRSGVDDDPNIYRRRTFRGDERTIFDANGKLLNLTSYNKLEKGAKAGIIHDTKNWDFWGAPYDFAANQGVIVGDGSRQFVQIRADFTSTANASTRLDYVQFAVSIPPVASQVLAEIVPVAVPPGQVTPFTYKLWPELVRGDLGFDTIGIDTPSQATTVDQVRISGEPVEFELMSMDELGFVVKIPRIDVQRTHELIEVEFQAEVFKFGTVFSGRVFNSRHPFEVPQSVTPGDADKLEDSSQLSVDLSQFSERLIRKLTLNPPAFSPNGDGINDVVWIEYELVNLVGSVPVRAEVYDLSGRSVGVALDGQAGSGRFTEAWNGRDGSGSVLPPGLYILKLSLDADKGVDVRQAVVSLVY